MKSVYLWSCGWMLVLASACSSTRPHSATAAERATPGYSDSEIEARLELLDPRTVQRGESRQLVLDLHNKTSQRLEFQITIDWFDAKGLPVALAPLGWRPLKIDGGATQPLIFEPMPQDARGWRLRYTSTGGDR
jgi:hypothetical protein